MSHFRQQHLGAARRAGFVPGYRGEPVDVRPVLDLLQKACLPARQVLLHKAMPASAAKGALRRWALMVKSAVADAQHPQEMAARLAAAVLEGRIDALNAARAENLLGAGMPLPADLMAMIEPLAKALPHDDGTDTAICQAAGRSSDRGRQPMSKQEARQRLAAGVAGGRINALDAEKARQALEAVREVTGQLADLLSQIGQKDAQHGE